MTDNEEYHVHRTANHVRGAGLHGVYQNKTRARNLVDKLDNEYGAVAHVVRTMPKTTEALNILGAGKPYGSK